MSTEQQHEAPKATLEVQGGDYHALAHLFARTPMTPAEQLYINSFLERMVAALETQQAAVTKAQQPVYEESTADTTAQEQQDQTSVDQGALDTI